MKVIIPFGPPSTGKGTRISEVLDKYGEQYESLAVGNMLRKEREDKTELGRQAQAYMDSGDLVPDQLIIAMFLERIKQSEKNLFFDGFPRTVGQAKAMLEAGIKPDLVIELQVDEEVMLQRALDRIVCAGCGESFTEVSDFKRPKVAGICDLCGGALKKRTDDANPELVKERLRVFEEKTRPVLDYLQQAGVRVCTMNNSSATAKDEFMRLVEEC